MKLWLGITDTDWFKNLSHLSREIVLDEVNFWQARWRGTLGILQQGESFLFKLRHPI